MTGEQAHYPIDLGSLPGGWTWRFVGDIAMVQSGFPSGRHNAEGEGVPHLRPMNVDGLGRINLNELKYLKSPKSNLRLCVGDVLFNNTNSPVHVGKTAYFGKIGDFAFSNHMTRLRACVNVNPKFLAFQLQWLWTTGYFRVRCTNHVNQASISTSTLARTVPVLVSPLDEQRRIVEVIEEQFSRLDAAEASLSRVELGAMALADAAYRSILSCKWPSIKLATIANTSSGGTPSRRKTDNFDGAIPWVKSGELGDSHVRATAECISNRGLASSSAKLLKRGTLMMAMYGATVGKLGILDLDFAATNQAVCAIDPHDPEIVEFLRLCLRAMRRDLIRSAKGGAQPNISQGMIRDLMIPMPPSAERGALVSEVSRQVNACERVGTAAEQGKMRIRQLRRSILELAFSGRLGPRLENESRPSSKSVTRNRGRLAPRGAIKPDGATKTMFNSEVSA